MNNYTIPDYAIRCAAWAMTDIDPFAAKYESDESLIAQHCAMVRAALLVLAPAMREALVREMIADVKSAVVISGDDTVEFNHVVEWLAGYLPDASEVIS